MRYWLFKTEPEVYAIDDLKRDGVTAWDGVRNYQARNLLRDGCRVGDLVLIYHSNADPTGVAGLGRIARAAYPDPTALDRRDPHHDPKATAANNPWVAVDVRFEQVFPTLVTLAAMKADPRLEGMLVTRRGQRLSIQPVEPVHFKIVCRMGRAG